ncbi:hypothetical protein D3Z36_09485 [Lachnospiraceae bacterium]|nr:hypothetical protein [Lachnospiraceae bacterium]
MKILFAKRLIRVCMVLGLQDVVFSKKSYICSKNIIEIIELGMEKCQYLMNDTGKSKCYNKQNHIFISRYSTGNKIWFLSYTGPKPSKGTSHQYYFTVYVLDCKQSMKLFSAKRAVLHKAKVISFIGK